MEVQAAEHVGAPMLWRSSQLMLDPYAVEVQPAEHVGAPMLWRSSQLNMLEPLCCGGPAS